MNRPKNILLTEETIKTLHRICCPLETAGSYRTTQVLPIGKGHKPSEPEEIDHYMHHFINQLETSYIMFDPIEFAAIAYKRLLDIFPFESHNEETAALFMNMLLVREGYAVIDSPSRLEGYDIAMEKAREMPFPDTEMLTNMVRATVEDLQK